MIIYDTAYKLLILIIDYKRINNLVTEAEGSVILVSDWQISHEYCFVF